MSDEAREVDGSDIATQARRIGSGGGEGSSAVAEAMRLAEKMMRDSWATGDDAAWKPAREALEAQLVQLVDAEVKRYRLLIDGLLSTSVGRQVLLQLGDGQGTNTEDGRAWLRAQRVVSSELSGGEQAGAKRRSMRRMAAARDFPTNTCGASRHAQELAELLMSNRPLNDLQQERQHCGESIGATVQALWKLRTGALRVVAAMDKLDEGAEQPGFRGWQNGNGVACGNELEQARQALTRLVRGRSQGAKGTKATKEQHRC